MSIGHVFPVGRWGRAVGGEGGERGVARGVAWPPARIELWPLGVCFQSICVSARFDCWVFLLDSAGWLQVV